MRSGLVSDEKSAFGDVACHTCLTVYDKGHKGQPILSERERDPTIPKYQGDAYCCMLHCYFWRLSLSCIYVTACKFTLGISFQVVLARIGSREILPAMAYTADSKLLRICAA